MFYTLADHRITDLDTIIGNFYKQYNLFRRRFAGTPSYVQSYLFSTYCSSFYGILLIPLNKMKKDETIYRKALRNIWNLPFQTHCDLLKGLPNTPCWQHMFTYRFMKFATMTLQHKSRTIRHIFQLPRNNRLSVFSDNLELCITRLNLDLSHIEDMSWPNIMKLIQRDCQTVCKVTETMCASHTVCEATMIRDGLKETILIQKFNSRHHTKYLPKLTFIFHSSNIFL